ncbi:MAG: LamG-like jellyroll fold domain-containing protein [Planctomycetota bacterium]|nr:LamG-like jellyroll fold domain-containing protein [Planctomycetota bacterium]
MKFYTLFLFSLFMLFDGVDPAIAQRKFQPRSYWQLNSQSIKNKKLNAIVGTAGELTFTPRFVKDGLGESALFENQDDRCFLAKDYKTLGAQLPTDALTVSAWFSVDTPQEWGGIINVIQDNGNYEKGWYLGYGEKTFTFGLSTTGADDGDGKISYIPSKTNYEAGKFYHVVAVFDGKVSNIYVNGKLETTDATQHGKILYPERASYVIGSYVDDDEAHPHHGRIREVQVFGDAVDADWVAGEYARLAALAQEPANVQEPLLELALLPYLHVVDDHHVTIMWDTNIEASSQVHYGLNEKCELSTVGPAERIHEVQLTGLMVDTPYFYRVVSKTKGGQQVSSAVAKFRIRVNQGVPSAMVSVVNRSTVPSGRTITPVGDLITFSGRPVDIEVSADGNVVYVKDKSSLLVVNATTFELLDSVTVNGGASLYGLAVGKDGHIYFSDTKNQVHVYQLTDEQKLDALAPITLPGDSFPCGICLSDDGKQIYICLSKKNALAIVDIATREITQQIPVGVAPFDVIQIGGQLIVSNIGGRRSTVDDKTASSGGTETVVDERGIASTGTLSIVSLANAVVAEEVVVGLHPSVLADVHGTALVCNSNEDSLSILDLSTKLPRTMDVKPDERLAFGSMPSCVRWVPDQGLLLVSLAGNNAIGIFKRQESGEFKSIGHLPTAWYPAGMAFNDQYLFVSNVKGYGSRYREVGNDQGHNSHDHRGVVQRIAFADINDPSTLQAWTNQVAKNSKFSQILRNQMLTANKEVVAPVPIPEKLGEPSLFKHIIYVIKENRTFDQVFGDYKQARSAARLCVFPRDVTPNHHALADRFGILDNYYCNGVNSADGHSWATEGNVTPYLERAFGGFSRSYTFGDDPITYSSSGFLWDHVLAAGLSFRNYGEMNYSSTPGGIKYHEVYRKFEEGEPMVFGQNIGIERLRKYSSPTYPGWNMEIPDVLRIQRFIKEFREYEKQGTFPNLSIVYLPQDHAGAGGVTSAAHLADNDLALGQLIEVISHSKIWKETVIFVNEDDPQAGWDHVDGHRSICLVVSPYSKPGVNHHFYNQTSVLRTMLHILGLPPMNQQDASAPLMRECFQTEANLQPYVPLKSSVAVNQKPAAERNWTPLERRWREVLATVPIQRTGMKTEQDEDNLNRFIWHDVKGWRTPYPVKLSGAHGRGLGQRNLLLDGSGDED